MGIEDPYLGLLSEEVETAQQDALQSLASRGMIQSVSETQIEFQDDLSTLANILHQPTPQAPPPTPSSTPVPRSTTPPPSSSLTPVPPTPKPESTPSPPEAPPEEK
jgi:hypothetical protein